MKTAPSQTAEVSALDKPHSNSKFAGTDNPRHLRAIQALMTRAQRREHLDSIAGCSNSPELVAELRRRGLTIPCQRVADLDRDGRPIKRGVYHLISSDRSKVNGWLKTRESQGGNHGA